MLERGRFRVRDRSVLRYYARTIEHLLVTTGRTALDARQRLQGLLSPPRPKRHSEEAGLPVRDAAAVELRHRFIAGETVEEAIEAARVLEARGLTETFDYLGESVTTLAEADAATRDYLDVANAIMRAGIERNISLKLTQLGLDVDRASAVDNLRKILELRRAGRLLRPHRHGELEVHRR